MKTKLKISGNIIINYSAVMLFMVISVSSMMGFMISRFQENHLFLVHIEFYPELVNLIVKKDPAILQAISDSPENAKYSEMLDSVINELLEIKRIDKTALLTMDGEIAAGNVSNDSLIDLKRNAQYLKALTGSTGYEYSEHEGTRLLKLYIPLKSENSVKGVVYISEGSSHLTAIVHSRKITIWIIISLSGLLLYFLLFSIFYLSYRKQKIINIQLRQTQDVD
jgi:hypothetical protein